MPGTASPGRGTAGLENATGIEADRLAAEADRPAVLAIEMTTESTTGTEIGTTEEMTGEIEIDEEMTQEMFLGPEIDTRETKITLGIEMTLLEGIKVEDPIDQGASSRIDAQIDGQRDGQTDDQTEDQTDVQIDDLIDAQRGAQRDGLEPRLLEAEMTKIDRKATETMREPRITYEEAHRTERITLTNTLKRMDIWKRPKTLSRILLKILKLTSE